MATNADSVLKLALAAAALLGGGGVGYYYGIYLPAQDVRRQTLALHEKQAAQAQAARALAEKVRREQVAQRNYDGCLAEAEASYRDRWTQACTIQSDADRAAYDDCADDLFSTARGCLAKHPVRPPQDCALPAETARDYAEARDARKAQCQARLEAAQGAVPTGDPALPAPEGSAAATGSAL